MKVREWLPTWRGLQDPRVSLSGRAESLEFRARPGRARDLDLDDAQTNFSNTRDPRMEGCHQALRCSWEPLKVVERGMLPDRAGSRQQTRWGQTPCSAGPWDRVSLLKSKERAGAAGLESTKGKVG